MPFQILQLLRAVRPHMTVDDDIPKLCRSLGPGAEKELVRDNHAETDLFFGAAGAPMGFPKSNSTGAAQAFAFGSRSM